MKNSTPLPRFFLILALVALLVVAVLVHSLSLTGYEAVRHASADGEFIGVRRAMRLAGAERVFTAGGEVLVFAGGGPSQAEFSRPSGLSEVSCRVWARVRPDDVPGEVRVTLATPEGEEFTAVLPKRAAPGRWHWLDLGTTTASRFRVMGQGEVPWLLQGLGLVPESFDGAPAPPFPLPGTEVERHFGDSFARSPGHGIGEWEARSGEWQLEFSYDPNRIPMQYSLLGQVEAGGDEALLAIQGLPWLGSRMSVAVYPDSGAQCGLALVTESGIEHFLVQAGGEEAGLPRVESDQWYLLTLEAWGWTRRFFIDGREVLTRHDAAPAPHRPALLLAAGASRFDDVQVSSIAWGGEDGAGYRLPWRPGENANWGRLRGGAALLGRQGELALAGELPPLHEVVLWADGEFLPPPGATAETRAFAEGMSYHFGQTGGDGWNLAAPAKLGRVAVASFAARPDWFRIGPYRFDEATIPDPSDYLDFTPEEWEEIRRSPEADKLARKARNIPVVGRDSQHSVWGTEAGRWRVADGALQAGRRGGRLRFWKELEGDFTFSFRVLVESEDGVAQVILGEQDGQGLDVVFHGPQATAAGGVLAFPAAVGEWLAGRIELAGDRLVAQIEGEEREAQVERGVGGGILLAADGAGIAFDDIEILVSRRTADQWLHAFDRREPDWWREGGQWIDHGGIACAIASNWVSLLAPESEGMIWHKQTFAGDVLLAANIEENTEWIGWEQDPSHIHHPFDNIVLCLGQGRDPDSGYRLEVNSRDRTATVLYRRGVEVAKVEQDREFPIQYVGGHAPYRPRRNRLALVREGNRLRAVVNGTEVLAFEDGEPLPTDTVGVGGYRTLVNFSRILVRQLD